MDAQADELSARDTAGALRNVSVAKAVNIGKASAIRGRPTEVVSHRSLESLRRTLVAKHPGLVVDSTAEELPPVAA